MCGHCSGKFPLQQDNKEPQMLPVPPGLCIPGSLFPSSCRFHSQRCKEARRLIRINCHRSFGAISWLQPFVSARGRAEGGGCTLTRTHLRGTVSGLGRDPHRTINWKSNDPSEMGHPSYPPPPATPRRASTELSPGHRFRPKFHVISSLIGHLQRMDATEERTRFVFFCA